MKLNLKDRIVISALYPKQANLIEHILIRDIQKKAGLTQDEITKYKITVTNDSVNWEGTDEFDVEFTDTELALLKRQIDTLDKKNQITQDIVDLCLKIQGK